MGEVGDVLVGGRLMERRPASDSFSASDSEPSLSLPSPCLAFLPLLLFPSYASALPSHASASAFKTTAVVVATPVTLVVAAAAE
ncbi:hypothetical protein CVT25_011559 [Psilocybe cyanescens]|uniref:Uncharacterized protein n=1 Tax=Psilocybe cyanescens TaxID=93625 RepID=A0A409X0P6_PSICY|nr:hypothetical protein CVT25_011559 [Psilocybe cyanescens]